MRSVHTVKNPAGFVQDEDLVTLEVKYKIMEERLKLNTLL
jgi:hypothetical protein